MALKWKVQGMEIPGIGKTIKDASVPKGMDKAKIASLIEQGIIYETKPDTSKKKTDNPKGDK